MSDPVRASEFLAALFEGQSGFVNVRALAPVEQIFTAVEDFPAIEAFVRARRDRDLYVGVATRLTPADGSLANCGGLPALFVDIDFKDVGEDEARASLASLPFPPSAVVQSGGGLHVYWLLKEPIDLATDAAVARDMLRRLARALRGDRAAAEPARILRLPNTLNYKYQPARPVRIEAFHPARRYNVSEFDEWLPTEPRDVRVLPGPVPDVIGPGMRDTYLTSIAGGLRRRGVGAATILAALRAENEARVRPPLGDTDLQRIATSVSRYAPEPASADLAPFVDPLPLLLERAASMPEPRWLVEGLIPGDGSVLIHSQPREYKTLSVQALMLAIATGTPAFALDRLHVADARPVWYVTEEDGWWRVSQRFGQLMRGYGLQATPDLLHVSAGKGLNLDAPEWQERMIATAREQGYAAVVWDPLRSLTETADQGPRELKPFALFLRRFIRETNAVVIIVHHDTKPPAQATDQRRRPQRASGGGVFSIADAPIHVDRVDDHRRMLVPCDYKFAAEPPSITVRLEQGPDWIRLVGEETTAVKADDAVVDIRILDYLKNSPFSYGNAVAKGVRANKEFVLQRLKALFSRGLVDCVEEGKGTKWHAKRAS